MKERYSITQNTDGSTGFAFSNGSLTLPAENGCYVLSTGCGSGKTESIKSLIRHKHKEGVLYCVDTIVSLNAMYEWIKEELVGTGIHEDDVMCITSENTPESAAVYELYKNNPELLMSKQIILITHVRFWTDLINYFLVYKPTSSIPTFDGNFAPLLGRNDLRGWVIFDETPSFILPFFEMKRSLLAGFSVKVGTEWRSKTKNAIIESYNEFLKDTPDDPFKDDTRLDRIKKEVAASLIPKYHKSWMGEKDKKGKVGITFTPSMLIRETVNTKILILEGAGDVLLKGSGCKFLSVPGTYYNAGILFNKIDFTPSRKDTDPKESIDQIEKVIRERLANNTNSKTLVIVWKSVGDGARDNDGAGESKHRDLVYSELLSRGIQPNQFDVSYFGANDTKSVNKYSDFDGIILLGKWSLPNSQAAEFNSNWGTSITSEQLNLWYFVQLICRIGIRKHDGKSYHVFYTSDYSKKFIQAVEDYFYSNATKVTSSIPQTWKEIMERKEIRKDVAKKIEKIVVVRPDLIPKIESKGIETFSIKTKDLWKILNNMKRPDSSKYKGSIGKALESLGVELELTK